MAKLPVVALSGAKKKSKKGRKTKAKGKPKLTAPTAKAVRDIVKQTLMSTAETKFVSDATNDVTIWQTINSEITGTQQFARGICPLSQTTTQGSSYTRVGDSIVPRQTKVALDVRLKSPSPQTPFPYDVNVVVYYGYCKQYTTYDEVDANSATLASQLLRLGGESAPGVDTTAFRGYISDSHLPINTDTWVLKKEVFRLHKPAGILNGAVGPGVTASTQRAQHSLMLDYASMCPPKLRYDSTQAVNPANWAPVFTLGYYYSDNSAPNTGTDGIIEYKATRFLTFKDF